MRHVTYWGFILDGRKAGAGGTMSQQPEGARHRIGGGDLAGRLEALSPRVLSLHCSAGRWAIAATIGPLSIDARRDQRYPGLQWHWLRLLMS